MTFKPNEVFEGEERPLYTQEELKQHRKNLQRQRARASAKLRAIIDVELDYLNRQINE